MPRPSHPSLLTSYLLLITLFSFLLFFSACTTPVSSPTPHGSTITPVPSGTLTPTPFLLASEMPLASPTANPLPTPPRPQYMLYAVFDFDVHYLTVEQTILYPNQTGESLTSVLLAVEPNYWPGCFVLDSLIVNGQPSTAHTLDGQRLEIALPQSLAPGATFSLGFKYQLFLPPIDLDRDPNFVRPQIFGYTARQTNLVHWYPFIVPYVLGQGWLLYEPWAYGEHLVYDVADFEVNLRFTDPVSAPVVAASGPAERNGEWMRYRLENGRTFALSASREYQVSSQTAGSVTVYSYYYPFFEYAGKAVLQASAQAVQIYSERFGPYPHTILNAIQADFADGMEYSGLYFLSHDFYNQYNYTPQNYLTIITVHETAHQWWFELVASDQTLEPWLDEALCTYSEHVFYEQAYPDLLGWWWGYRVDFYQPTGWVDVRVDAAGGYEPYRQAVYLRGAKFLEALRLRVGDKAFFAFMKDYATQYAFRRATADDFFALLRQHTSVDFSDIVQQYLRNPH